MFGALFFIAQEVGANGAIFGQIGAAFSRASDRANVDFTAFDANKHLGAGADNGEIAQV